MVDDEELFFEHQNKILDDLIYEKWCVLILEGGQRIDHIWWFMNLLLVVNWRIADIGLFFFIFRFVRFFTWRLLNGCKQS